MNRYKAAINTNIGLYLLPSSFQMNRYTCAFPGNNLFNASMDMRCPTPDAHGALPPGVAVEPSTQAGEGSAVRRAYAEAVHFENLSAAMTTLWHVFISNNWHLTHDATTVAAVANLCETYAGINFGKVYDAETVAAHLHNCGDGLQILGRLYGKCYDSLSFGGNGTRQKHAHAERKRDTRVRSISHADTHARSFDLCLSLSLSLSPSFSQSVSFVSVSPILI